MLGERKNQFSLACAALSTCRAQKEIPIRQLSFDALAGRQYQISLLGSSGSADPALFSLYLDAREFCCPTPLPDGAFGFQMVTTPGRTWIIEVGTNLLNQTPISTGYRSDGVLKLLDPAAASHSRRFYRAVTAP